MDDIFQKYRSGLVQAVKQLDWVQYQELVRQYQSCFTNTTDVPEATNLLYLAVTQQPQSFEATQNQVSLVKDLIHNQALDHSHHPALNQACLFGNITAIKILLAAGCHISTYDILSLLERIFDDKDKFDLATNTAKVFYLISRDHIDFTRILAVDNVNNLDFDRRLIRKLVTQSQSLPQDLTRAILLHGLNFDRFNSESLVNLLTQVGLALA